MQIKMLKNHPIGTRRKMQGDSVIVDDKTAALLIRAKIAEPDESQQYETREMVAVDPAVPVLLQAPVKKRAYKKRGTVPRRTYQRKG